MKRFLYNGIWDGLLHGLLLIFVGGYSASVFALHSYAFDLALIAACVIVTAVSAHFAFRHQPPTRLWIILLISCLIFSLIALLGFCNLFTLKLRVFPQRELGDADGIIMLLYQALYLFVSAITRIVLFVFALISAYRKRKTA